MKTKDGRPRRFCFIGFKNETDGEDAVKFYNESFIDTSKIHVEMAKTVHDSTLVTKQDRLKRKTEAEQKHNVEKRRRQDDKKAKSKLNSVDIPEDPRLQEFLEVMNSRQSGKAWANDDGLANVDKPIGSDQPVNDKSMYDRPARPATAIPASESDDEYEEIPTKQAVDNFEEDENEQMIPLDQVADSSNAADPAISDLEWLQMKRQRMSVKDEKQYLEEQLEHSGTDNTMSVSKESHIIQESVHDKSISQIMATRRLFLRNLLYTSTEDDFRNLFSQYSVEEVHVPVDPKSGKSKGFAYILFTKGEDAVSAYESLDGSIFQGRLLHILPGQPKREHKLDEFDLKNLPLRKQHALKRKAEAAKQDFSWNSLYLSGDAVMESVAKKLGVQKSELINADSSDSAVKQALAETSVLADIKQYFESHGVDLSSFANTKQKDDRVILIKNLPFGTMVDEITDLFSQYGEMSRVLMPPDGTICMVVFKNNPEARAAFAKLAYRRFKNSILYLEKGPKGLFDGAHPVSNTASLGTASKPSVVKAKPAAADVLGVCAPQDDEDVDLSQRTSLYIKNLNFKTTSTGLYEAFKALDGVASARIQTKPDAHNPGQTKSMGYGFVEFNTKQQAITAMKVMQGHIIQGHELQIQLAQRGSDDEIRSRAGQTKIIIKNIPFEASKSDIQKLFGTFGQLKSVRLPRKFDKSARGFAFAEFVTAKEAENALKALQGTHLLGRRLVMQYAQADAVDAQEEIERMEAKVRKQVTQETLQGLRLSGKRRLELGEDDNE